MSLAKSSALRLINTHVPGQQTDGTEDLDRQAAENDRKTASSEVNSPAVVKRRSLAAERSWPTSNKTHAVTSIEMMLTPDTEVGM